VKVIGHFQGKAQTRQTGTEDEDVGVLCHLFW
jgi:hypothetical protein